MKILYKKSNKNINPISGAILLDNGLLSSFSNISPTNKINNPPPPKIAAIKTKATNNSLMNSVISYKDMTV
ncbi:hypothetical protein C8N25_11430 [Algoriphagus antarcticus]|uniref:Uncharacterized protein n=1 Tax=Algoriphagus antarcticus TaxID=238540 RepID=A0A3E0DRV4_9BACT|nr:hypothetical protein C8N25_11430 [Algoriphagus antarcticus]